MQFHLSIGVSQFQAQRFNLHHDLRQLWRNLSAQKQLIPPKKTSTTPRTRNRSTRNPVSRHGTLPDKCRASRIHTPRPRQIVAHFSGRVSSSDSRERIFFSQRVRNQSLRMPGRPGGIFSRPRRDRLEPVYPAFVPKRSTADNKLGARSANMGCACVRKGNLRVPNLNNPKWSNGFSFRGPGILWDILSQAQVPNISHRCGV